MHMNALSLGPLVDNHKVGRRSLIHVVFLDSLFYLPLKLFLCPDASSRNLMSLFLSVFRRDSLFQGI